jgi:hypothetical protein
VRENRRILGSAATVTVALGILLGVGPTSTERLLAGYLIVLAAIVLLELVRRFREHIHPEAAYRFEQALRERRSNPATRPPAFIAMEREIEQGVEYAVQAHRRLLPLLRSAAAARLAVHHGIELEHRPDAARSLLGDEAWELLRPDRPEPVDRRGPGLPRATIAMLIERVETL